VSVLQLVFFANYFKRENKEWDDGEVTEVHSLEKGEFNKAQFELRTFGLACGILFMIVGPVLFLPACRGSLINTFLGIRYGTAIKWHRCVERNPKGTKSQGNEILHLPGIHCSGWSRG
jgi:hypothetical protein